MTELLTKPPQQESQNEERSPQRRRLPRWRHLLILSAVILAGIVWWPKHGSIGSDRGRTNSAAAIPLQFVSTLAPARPIKKSPGSKSKRHETANDPENEISETGDERFKTLVVGSWQKYQHGNRTLTINEDGTADLIVEPDGIWKYLLGDRIQIDIEWKIEEGRAIFLMTGGTPSSKVDVARKLFGDKRDRPIVELTQERFVLLDEEDDEEDVWTRIDDETP